MKAKSAALAALCVSALAGQASAHPHTIPQFATMDRMSDSSFFGVDLSNTFTDGDAIDYALRLELYGQYVSRQLGGYVSLPVSFLGIDGVDDETAIGNLELSGFAVLGAGRTPIIVRGGLLLPTAGDGLEDVLTNAVTAFARVTDLAMIVPETTWLRLSGSIWQHRVGQAFFRFDLGFDLPVDDPDGADADPLLRINAGGGFDTGSVAFMGEVATLGLLGDDDGDDDFVHTLGVTVRGRGETAPGLSLIVPLDDDIDIDFILLFSLHVGIGPR